MEKTDTKKKETHQKPVDYRMLWILPIQLDCGTFVFSQTRKHIMRRKKKKKRRKAYCDAIGSSSFLVQENRKILFGDELMNQIVFFFVFIFIRSWNRNGKIHIWFRLFARYSICVCIRACVGHIEISAQKRNAKSFLHRIKIHSLHAKFEWTHRDK